MRRPFPSPQVIYFPVSVWIQWFYFIQRAMIHLYCRYFNLQIAGDWSSSSPCPLTEHPSCSTFLLSEATRESRFALGFPRL